MRSHLSTAAFVLLVTAGLAAQATVTRGPSAIPAPNMTIASARRFQPAPVRGIMPNVFTTIQGNALNSTNGALPYNAVRLRDAHAGRIIGSQVTDKSGLFAFRGLDPGSYIVELIAPDQATILSASQILSLDAGQALTAVVKLPFHISPFAGLLGHTVPSAVAVSSAAASSGVMAATVAGEPLSPQ